MDDALTERVEALERAVTDGDHDLSSLTDEADARERLEQLEKRFGTLHDRVAELEAATQALRGYVGNIRAVNEDVEKRAELALTKAEALETDTPTADSGSESTDTHSPNVDSNASNGGEFRSSAHRGSDSGLRESDSRPRQTRCETCGSIRAPLSANPGSPDSTARNGSDDGVVGQNETTVESSGATDRRVRQAIHNGTGCEATRRTTEDSTDSETGRSEADPFESLGSEDPLVSDDTEDSNGRLSRFRELL